VKRFWLQRNEDVSGVSGVGRVAEGVQFTNGKCALSWLTPMSSIVIYDSVSVCEAIHGHDGATIVIWEEES
jgi:hypothetical protein